MDGEVGEVFLERGQGRGHGVDPRLRQVVFALGLQELDLGGQLLLAERARPLVQCLGVLQGRRHLGEVRARRRHLRPHPPGIEHHQRHPGLDGFAFLHQHALDPAHDVGGDRDLVLGDQTPPVREGRADRLALDRGQLHRQGGFAAHQVDEDGQPQEREGERRQQPAPGGDPTPGAVGGVGRTHGRRVLAGLVGLAGRKGAQGGSSHGRSSIR